MINDYFKIILFLCAVTPSSGQMYDAGHLDTGRTNLSGYRMMTTAKNDAKPLRGASQPAIVSEQHRLVLPPVIAEERQGEPNRIGISRPIRQSAVEELWGQHDGQPRVLSLRSPGARALRLHLKNVDLGQAQLRVYGQSGDSCQPYRGRGPFGDGSLWTCVIFGDTIDLMLDTTAEPGNSLRTPTIQIAELAHIDPDLFSGAAVSPPAKAAPERTVASCHIDFSCLSAWQALGQSTALMVYQTSGGTSTCTGTLVNSTPSAKRPYLLTASHCIDTPEEARSLTTVWGFQSPQCNGFPRDGTWFDAPPEIRALTQQIEGARLLVATPSDTLDASLLELLQTPRNAYFAGWDARDLGVGERVWTIHHPRASWKRISTGVRVADPIDPIQDRPIASNLYSVNYDAGILQRGSSGSAIYRGVDMVTGMLSRGFAPPEFLEDVACLQLPRYQATFTKLSAFFPAIREFLDPPVPGTALSATPAQVTLVATPQNTLPSAQLSVATSGAPGTFATLTVSVSHGLQWLSVSPTSATLPATFVVRANANNFSPGSYDGRIVVSVLGSQVLQVPVLLRVEAPQTTVPRVSAVTNAASFLQTPVSPGMIVTIFGQGLGPSALVRLRTTPAGAVDTTLDGVRVRFDSIPAPLLFVRNDVVSAVVPYGVVGLQTTRITVEYRGAMSSQFPVRVVNTGPAVFTANQQGSGQGAIQNSDFSLNGATNPAWRGDFVIIYFTGEGPTVPFGVDGIIASPQQLRRPVGRVEVRIGGRPAQVLYAGSVPTVVLGMAQANVVVPMDAPTGPAVPIEISVDSVPSQSGVTMAVR